MSKVKLRKSRCIWLWYIFQKWIVYFQWCMSFKSSKAFIFFLILCFSYKDDFKRQNMLKKLTFAMIIFLYVIEKASRTIRIKSNIEQKRKQKILTKELHLLTQLGCDDLWLPCHNLLEWVNAVSKTPYKIISKSTFDVIKHVFKLVFESIIWVCIYHI